MFGFGKKKINNMDPALAYKKAKDSKNPKRAFSYYESAAQQGHPDAQYELGKCYYYGHGCEENDERAIHWYEKAVEGGHALAAQKLGYLYSTGTVDEIKPDDSKSLYWYERAAELGDVRSMRHCAELYEAGKRCEHNSDKALYWYEKASGQDDVSSMLKCAKLYLHRISLENCKKSHYWYEKAAEKDNADAQYSCGDNYWKGFGCTKDPEKALYWFERSAKNGYSTAMRRCAEAYDKGDGCEEDPEKAKYWYEKLKVKSEQLVRSYADYPSLAQGHKNNVELAEKALARLNGVPSTPPAARHAPAPVPDPEPAPAQQPKQQGSVTAKRELTAEECYQEGRKYDSFSGLGTSGKASVFPPKEDTENAFYWYQKAAQKGSLKAQTTLALMYSCGFGCTANNQQAFIWYAQAAFHAGYDKNTADDATTLAYNTARQTLKSMMFQFTNGREALRKYGGNKAEALIKEAEQEKQLDDWMHSVKLDPNKFKAFMDKID